MTPPPEKHVRGWTLVELLVAIIIIGILLAFLAAALGAAKRQFANARCVNNLRQIGAGLHLYAQDHGMLPYYIDGSTRWFDGMEAPRSFFAGPYLQTQAKAKRLTPPGKTSARNGIFDCPAIGAEEKAGLGPDDWTADYFDYGLNISLCGWPVGHFAHPSTTVLVAEGGHYARVKAQWTTGRLYTPTEPSNPGGTAWNWSTTNSGTAPIIYNKTGYANFLFLDGHVGRHAQTELTEEWFNGR